MHWLARPGDQGTWQGARQGGGQFCTGEDFAGENFVGGGGDCAAVGTPKARQCLMHHLKAQGRAPISGKQICKSHGRGKQHQFTTSATICRSKQVPKKPMAPQYAVPFGIFTAPPRHCYPVG